MRIILWHPVFGEIATEERTGDTAVVHANTPENAYLAYAWYQRHRDELDVSISTPPPMPKWCRCTTRKRLVKLLMSRKNFVTIPAQQKNCAIRLSKFGQKKGYQEFWLTVLTAPIERVVGED